MSVSASPHRPHSTGTWLTLGIVAAVLAALCLILLLRASIATVLVRRYLAAQDMSSNIVVDSIGLNGATAHGRLSLPGISVSFQRLAVRFDPHHWLPHVAAITIERPTVILDLRRPFKSSGGNGFLGRIAVDIAHARIVALTTAGRVEIVGRARLTGDKPQLIDAVLLPTRLQRGTLSADIKAGSLHYDATRRLRLTLAGDAGAGRFLHLANAHLALEIPELAWNGDFTAAARTAKLSMTATAQETASPWSVEARFSNLDFSKAGSSGDVAVTAGGSLAPAETRSLLAPVLAGDPALLKDYQDAFGALHAAAALSWRASGSGTDIALREPAEIRGGDTVVLRLLPGVVHTDAATISGQMAMALRGPGVPQLQVSVNAFNASNGGLDASIGLNGRISFAGVHDLTVQAQATARRHGGVFEIALRRCAAVRLGSFVSRGKRLIAGIAATLCGSEPLFSASNSGWTLQGQTRDVTAALPTTGLKLSGGSAELFVAGNGALPKSGLIHVSALVSDTAKAPRAGPETVSGVVEIAHAVAHGRFILAVRQSEIGTVTARYRIATGEGHADLDFPHLAFTRAGLQPVQISPLLLPLAQADGIARFSGQVDWDAKHITSSGRLDVDGLRFSSPLGAAQRLSTHMVFTSLLPLRTAPDQRVAIQRVDWVTPLTRSITRVTLTPNELKIVGSKTEVAGGEVSVSPLSVSFKPGATLQGTVKLSHIALGRLIAASNMGEKLKLEGPVSGTLPFSFGPEGWRFKNGRLEADGPGRLSINRTLWGKGETNAVQKAAYQALENLSYQSLTASIDSVPGGRLRAVFHVVGYDDNPGGPKQTEFKLFDLLSGKAFQKEIPIPRGTGVNLTLDTSLNFDELLRGYESTWSQVTAQTGAPP